MTVRSPRRPTSPAYSPSSPAVRFSASRLQLLSSAQATLETATLPSMPPSTVQCFYPTQYSPTSPAYSPSSPAVRFRCHRAPLQTCRRLSPVGPRLPAAPYDHSPHAVLANESRLLTDFAGRPLPAPRHTLQTPTAHNPGGHRAPLPPTARAALDHPPPHRSIRLQVPPTRLRASTALGKPHPRRAASGRTRRPPAAPAARRLRERIPPARPRTSHPLLRLTRRSRRRRVDQPPPTHRLAPKT